MGGSCTDAFLNQPHLNNKPVIIKAGPPPIVKAWYNDIDADGIVKDVYVQFLRPVNISDLSFIASWELVFASSIKDNALSYHNNDSSTIHIFLPQSFIDSSSIKTVGEIYIGADFLSTNQHQTGIARDSAAPVILHASIKASNLSDNYETLDTLCVFFSEDISVRNTSMPFSFTSQNNLPYSMNLSLLSVQNSVPTFLITGYDPNILPASGDSIRIYTKAVTDTSNNVQSNEGNRNAILTIHYQPSPIQIKAGPNPFNPAEESITITAMPVGKFKSGIKLSATVIIFDNLGNRIVPETAMTFNSQTSKVIYNWNGYNQHGRKAGSGTYLAIVKVTYNGVITSAKIPIGVDNNRLYQVIK